jgi:hypothetical protein
MTQNQMLAFDHITRKSPASVSAVWVPWSWLGFLQKKGQYIVPNTIVDK